jgi:hypothetical protein
VDRRTCDVIRSPPAQHQANGCQEDEEEQEAQQQEEEDEEGEVQAGEEEAGQAREKYGPSLVEEVLSSNVPV